MRVHLDDLRDSGLQDDEELLTGAATEDWLEPVDDTSGEDLRRKPRFLRMALFATMICLLLAFVVGGAIFLTGELPEEMAEPSAMAVALAESPPTVSPVESEGTQEGVEVTTPDSDETLTVVEPPVAQEPADTPPEVVVEEEVNVVPPSLTVREPRDNAWLTLPFVVAGTVESHLDVLVRVNGVEASLDGTEYRLEVELDDGIQELAVEALDASGLKTEALLDIRVDSNPPVIEMKNLDTLRSEPVIVAESEWSFVARIVDAGKLQSVTVNGQGVSVGSDGSLSHTVTVGRDGEHLVTIEARDRSGNRASKSVRILRDSVAPEVELDLPSGPLEPGEFVLQGSVRDTTECQVLVDGTELTLDDEGRFQLTL